jgi:ketosteroid isomerase-like protein
VSFSRKGKIHMNFQNAITEPEQHPGRRLAPGSMRQVESLATSTPRQTLQLALDALREGNISQVLQQMADDFNFRDQTLTLEFTDKLHLKTFLEKSRELFPGASLEVVSLVEQENHAIAQWKLPATQTVAYGEISCRFPVFLFGATIVRVEEGKIVQWTDYHDPNWSRRMSLPAFFTKGI